MLIRRVRRGTRSAVEQEHRGALGWSMRWEQCSFRRGEVRSVGFIVLGFAFLAALAAVPGNAQFARNRYTLILEDPPVAERFAGREAIHSAAGEVYRAQIETKQESLRQELASRNIQVTGSVSSFLNAVFVVASPDQVAALSSLPGVKAVIRQRMYKRQLNLAPGLIDVPAAWNTVGGIQNAGKGIKIGIIDSGVDQTHPALQDSTLQVPAGYPICMEASYNRNQTAVVETAVPSDCTNFTNTKVIVTRSYVQMLSAGSNPANPAADDRPDDNSPRDHSGHGTAIAAAAAGNTAKGTVTFNGIAPKAYVGSYKVYGSPGVNDSATDDVLIQAVEDAEKDAMDVVNLSSGGPALSGPLDTGAVCGAPTGVYCDPVARAYELAAEAGMLIVASSGDSGYADFNDCGSYPVYNTVASPADAPSVIAVSATTNAHDFNETVSVPGGAQNLQNIVTASGDSPTFYPGAVTLPLVDVTLLGDSGLLCNPLPSIAIPYGLYSAIALVERGTCNFSTKVTNAYNAGAIAVIIYMADSSPLVSPSGLFDLIPTVVVSNADGLNLKSYADSASGYYPSVTIDPGGMEVSDTANQNLLAGYSGIGPGLTCYPTSTGCAGNNPIKPDIVAVGGNVYFLNYVYTAAQTYDPDGDIYSSTGYSVASGTSLAAPMVAGAAAMVKQQHPTYTAAQIKSALINTATQDVLTDDAASALGLEPTPVDVQWYGGGKLDANAALKATVSVSPASLSFGAVTSLPQTLQLNLTNNGSSSVSLTLSDVPNPSYPLPISPAFDHSTLSLSPGASGVVNVTLSGTLPTMEEYSSVIAIQGSGVSLTVPYMYLIPDGSPYSLFPVGGDFDGTVGTTCPQCLAIQLTDDFGLPIANSPVVFGATGGGSVQNAAGKTNAYGIAYADGVLGRSPGDTTYTATAGGMSVTFDGFARVQPAIPANDVLNAESLSPTQAIAPGSYIAIGNGTNPATGLSDYTDASTTGRLPLSIDGVIVTFDVPSAGISVPGHLTYVSPTQINLQAPWELQGQSSVQIKVAVGYNSNSNVVTVPVSNYSPAFFQYSGNVIAQDANYKLIGPSNPVQRGGVAVLYMNGLGPVTNQPASGDPAPSYPNLAQTTTTPVVMIGGQQASVSFSGLTPTIAGLYQINVTIPSNLTPGPQPITVAIGGQTTSTSSIVVK
jgi:minor extracellular serine protease Vpr